jgi:hypothetical protein
MKDRKRASLVLVVLVAVCATVGAVVGQAQERPQVQIPNPGVPQIMTMEGKFVRVAYNNEGYVILGYQLANRSIGEEWMLLEVGITVRSRTPDYDLTRNELSIETPDGKTIPLATLDEFREANLAHLRMREKVQRDSINYFPPEANRGCAITFFPELDQRVMPRDEVELSSQRACLGRLYFRVPGGIAYGQHWLNVKFAQSLIRVPFRILTEDEEKMLQKNYKDIRQQVQEAFRPKN